MARRVKNRFRMIPQDTRTALAATKHMTTTHALGYLKKRRIPALTPISRVREISKRFGSRNKIAVVVSNNRNMFTPKKEVTQGTQSRAHADALARGTTKIYVHPVVQYYPESVVKDILEHEMDHVKVARRVEANWKKQGYKFEKRLKTGEEIWVKPDEKKR